MKKKVNYDDFKFKKKLSVSMAHKKIFQGGKVSMYPFTVHF